MSPNGLKAAIIGYGNIGKIHAKGYMADPRVTRLALAEPRPPFPEDLTGERVVLYPNARELLEKEKPDLVSISVPHDLHYPIALEVARYGRGVGGSIGYVLLEKPMALNPTEAAEIEQAFKTAGVHLMLAHSVRFSTPFRRLAELLAGQPELYGTPRLMLANYLMYKDYRQYPEWKRNKAKAGGGVLLRDGLHVLDAVLRVAGSRPVEVWGQAGRLVNEAEIEDTFLGGVLFENGSLAQLNFSNVGRAENELSLTVHTEKATLKANLEQLQVWSDSLANGESLPSTTQVPRLVEPARGDLWANQMAYFIECAASGTEPEVNGQDGRKVIEVITQLYEAARQGRHKQVTLV